MNLPDLLEATDINLFLRRMHHKRVKGSDPDAPAFDWTCTFEINLADEIVDDAPDYLPGAVDILKNAQTIGTGHVDFEPLDGRRATRITISRGTESVLEATAAEIRFIEVTATAKSSRYLARIKIFQLSLDASRDLLACAERGVFVSVVPVQTELVQAAA